MRGPPETPDSGIIRRRRPAGRCMEIGQRRLLRVAELAALRARAVKETCGSNY